MTDKRHPGPKPQGKLKIREPASPALIQSMYDALKGTSDRLNKGASPLSDQRKKTISDNIMGKLPPLSPKSR